MTAMRVAMLGQFPLDEARIVGGPEAVTVLLVHELARHADVELHVVTCQPRQKEHSGETASGIPLHVLCRRRMGRITFHYRDILHMRQVLRRIAPDVVHAQGMGIYAGAAIHSGYPHVVTAHGIFSREAEFAKGLASRARGILDSAYERYSVSRIKNLIAISPYVEEELLRIGGFGGQAVHIENPVADDYFKVDAGGRQATILYAGRVIPRKDLLTLLRALVYIREELPQVQLRIAGETESAPDYVRTCREFVQRSKLDTAVTFLGALTMADMVQEYARCTVLALSSRQETAPVVIAEAMAAARPVVATKVCGVPFMIEDGASGLLVEQEDADEMARVLVRVLGNPQLCLRLGRRGREMAEQRFRAQVVAGRTREIYRQLAETGTIWPSA